MLNCGIVDMAIILAAVFGGQVINTYVICLFSY